MTNGAGHVWLVGAGPGDPRLLTLAGADALAGADVVLYDALASLEILRHARPEAELLPVGKRAGAHSMKQEEINELLVAKASAGKRVVRLKGGDPFVYGRGGEEALACRAAGTAFTVVPGVTSAVAVPAYAGIPVTHRGMARSVTVITGSESSEGDGHDWAALAKVDTLVVLMGAASLADTAVQLIEAGRSPNTPAAAISNGTLPNQRSTVATLATIADRVREAELPTPLITVIGEVASLAGELSWRTAGPLAGKSVVVTRTRSQASQLRAMLEALGADVVEAPVLQIRPTTEELTTDERVSSRWDWLVFSSQNAVEAFFAALTAAGRDARSLGGTKVATVGAATAASLQRFGVLADFVPSTATGPCLAAELPRVHGARILLGEGSLSDGPLSDGLRNRGAHVERVKLYVTEPAPLDDELRERVLAADAITFASASSATFLAQALDESAPAASTRLCAIGPQAAAATRASFGRADAEAREPSLAGLVAAVVEALS